MAYDLANLRSKLRRQGYKANRYPDSDLNELINEAHLEICGMVAWGFLRKYAECAVSQNNTHLALPADYWKLIGATLSGWDTPLAPVDHDQLLLGAGASFSLPGVPTHIYHQEDDPTQTPREQWHVWPTPTSNFTVHLVYLKRPAALVSDNDVPSVPEVGKNLLIYKTLIGLHREAARWDALAEAKGAFADEWLRVFDSMMREHYGMKADLADTYSGFGGNW